MVYAGMHSNFKSQIWDAFPNGCSDLIKKEEVWPHMFRNSTANGFNDAFYYFSNKRFQTGSIDFWKEMKRELLADLI